ncbi:polysaccharide deacetylase family protein [Paenibacillus radicis (ex Xue et al. 2023)]|uniref:Polysaccharide deacetylase family protein n=1 Tax=Paenibacillus radicis (ex Xue et al. 2023) TaxID=2972489 RepID=A0ABT1YR11_9BACL|nr:polysaccharide deacetylase family protein [Paenibacillus radicis (ex Xue et al. 2023)]MCR8634723.1 polysaccharide deacetylase family protein [Paenibacillus radicis (ex Xue et al. 2023)]
MKTKWFICPMLTVFAMTFFICSCKSSTVLPNPTHAPISSTVPSPAKDTDLPEQLLESAREGKAWKNVFSVGQSTIDQIEGQWGNPDTDVEAGRGMYASFTGPQASFGYNKINRLVFDSRSYDQSLQNLTLQSIVESLGPPESKTEIGTDDIYSYNAASKYQLKFIIPKGTSNVDHISVFSEGSVQKGPEKPPASKGDYFLSIVGKSNQLTQKAWADMLAWRKTIVDFAKSHQGDIFINGPDEKKVALTFDDGPDDQTTPAIMDILNKYKVQASFFFIGKQVNQYPDVVKKVYENGHLVLNHSFKHDDYTKLDANQIHTDVKETEDAIRSVIGKTPSIMRTPYGATNDNVLAAVKKEGLTVVLWSIDTLDWSQKESDNIVNNVISNVRNGDIILMHSSKVQTVNIKALPIIIEQLQKKGFSIVNLETLLGIHAYK